VNINVQPLNLWLGILFLAQKGILAADSVDLSIPLSVIYCTGSQSKLTCTSGLTSLSGFGGIPKFSTPGMGLGRRSVLINAARLSWLLEPSMPSMSPPFPVSSRDSFAMGTRSAEAICGLRPPVGVFRTSAAALWSAGRGVSENDRVKERELEDVFAPSIAGDFSMGSVSEDADAASPCFSRLVDAILLRESDPEVRAVIIDRADIVSCGAGLSTILIKRCRSEYNHLVLCVTGSRVVSQKAIYPYPAPMIPNEIIRNILG
jgi:hypothetical protein